MTPEKLAEFIRIVNVDGVTGRGSVTKTWTYSPPECTCVDEHAPGCPVLAWLNAPPITIESATD